MNAFFRRNDAVKLLVSSYVTRNYEIRIFALWRSFKNV